MNDICALGGARVAPSADVLNEFCTKCENLDPDVIGALLAEKVGRIRKRIDLVVNLRNFQQI